MTMSGAQCRAFSRSVVDEKSSPEIEGAWLP